MIDPPHNIRITSLIESALEHFMVSDYNEAVRDLKAAEALDHTNPEILYNLGVNYARLGLHRTSLSYFDRLHDLDTGFVDSSSLRKIHCFVLLSLGEYKEAETIINRELHLFPESVPALGMKGYILEKTGRISDAESVYRKILTEKPDDLNAHNSLAWLLCRSKSKLKEALHHAGTAYKGNPKCASYCDTLACVLEKMGQKEKALRFYRQAHKLDPLSEEIAQNIKRITSGK